MAETVTAASDFNISDIFIAIIEFIASVLEAAADLIRRGGELILDLFD